MITIRFEDFSRNTETSDSDDAGLCSAVPLEALPKLDIHIEEGAVDTFTLTQEEDEMRCPVTLTFEALGLQRE